MENAGCLFVSVETFVDFRWHKNPVPYQVPLRRNVCQIRSNTLISIRVAVAAGTCVDFVASRCLAMDYSEFHVSCHNIKTLHSSYSVYLCVPYGCHIKQRLFT
jgi:hypothetical protein